VAPGSRGVGWITIDSATFGKGAATVTFSVSPNMTGKPRAAAIIVAVAGEKTRNKAFAVNQRR